MLRSRDRKGIFRAAVNPSLEAAGKNILFFTPRKIPFQSRLLVTVSFFALAVGYRVDLA
jgi:hypothetical protein